MAAAPHDVATPGALFEASRRVAFLDYFRTPYTLAVARSGPNVDYIRTHTDGRALLWPSARADDSHVAAVLSGADQGESIPIFGRVLPDRSAEALLAGIGGHWTAGRPILDLDGNRVASIWRSDTGDYFLPFDPDEVVTHYWSERYHGVASGPVASSAKRFLLRAYYRVRPILWRGLQIRLRRIFSRVQARRSFPRWPVETALFDFFEFLFVLLAELRGGPVPRIAAWPADYAWALVLTHDVETAKGLANLDRILELEQLYGFRSSWNFVPLRYDVDPALISKLAREGFEVGVHGLYHDGRDFDSLSTLQQQLPAIREYASRWGAVGFRSPATHREWEWMPLLGFEYDSSYPDTDPFEPQAGGCCSWLPFFNGELLELPITLPQDHTLFVILRRSDESAWVDKTSFLRARGGMGLLITHPDYLTDQRVLRAYGRFLERFADDPSVWKALPREVNEWWRRRASSRLELVDGSWHVVGPAAGDARVEFAGARS